jgi:hypothetical protein
LGAGGSVSGLAIAGVGVGSPTLKAIVIAPAVAAIEVKGLVIAPAYLQVGSKNSKWEKSGVNDPVIKGIAISAYNNIRGEQKGLTIGLFNYAQKQKGFQLGILNYVKDNPRGLRLLPIFNTRFGKRNESTD